MRYGVFILVAALLWAGCSTDRPDEEFFAPGDVGTLVVDGILLVGKPLPEIGLSRTYRPDGDFNVAQIVESGARIELYVEPDGPLVRYYLSALDPYPYYEPDPYYADLEVEPQTTYELRVRTLQGEVLSARTTTPERFSIDRWVLLDEEGVTVERTLKTFEELGDSVYYADENQLAYTQGLLEGQFVRSAQVPGYHIGIFSLDLDSDFVIDPAFFEPEDFEQLERTLSSPAFEAAEGQVRLPWFAIFYQGRYKIKVFAVDRNWYQLILTLPEFQGGFGGNVGESFNRPSFNIEGGIGLFGSASVDSIGFFILPRP